MFLSELEFLGIEFHCMQVRTCYPLCWINCCVCVCVFNFFCALYLFSSDPKFIISNTGFDAHCKTTGRISTSKNEMVEKMSIYNLSEFSQSRRPRNSKIDWHFCVGEAFIQRFCFIGNLIWVQRVIWLQIPATFKKGL